MVACCNRTIMVLKPRKISFSFSRANRLQSNHYGIETKKESQDFSNREKVAIEPLWYWNGRDWEVIFTELDTVAIEPLWYWNCFCTYCVYSGKDGLQSNHYGIETNLYVSSLIRNYLGCNRTIMVLKLSLFSHLLARHASCNRTIMVLKLFWTHTPRIFLEVAIEPLWYWNEEGTSFTSLTLLRCNRTIMVLKLFSSFSKNSPYFSLQSNHYGIETRWAGSW